MSLKKSISQKLNIALLVSMVFVSVNSAARSNEVCNDLNHLTAKAETGFSIPELDEIKSSLSMLSDVKDCGIVRQLDGITDLNYAWEFEYRSDIAEQSFNTLNHALKTCLGEDTAVKQDDQVNHPDFYDLRTYSTDNTTLAVSIKEKATNRRWPVLLIANFMNEDGKKNNSTPQSR